MKLANYSHVIWDWNGTLLDDVAIAMGITNSLLEERGLSQLQLAEYREVFDFPIIEYYQSIGFDPAEFDQLAEEFFSRFQAARSSYRLLPGTAELLEQLRLHGCRQSVLSATREHDLIPAVAGLGIAGYFCSIHGIADRHARSKLERGRRSLQELGCDPQRTVLIGDTTHDSEVAQALGIDCILIAAGHQSRRRLMQQSAMVFDSASDLL
ncbi:HAD family hydrolase [Spirochaeta africana]|uniref:phosphoglycolate phosphatase n=1 Tax=Spirochaeta africana (strain ATCC 700263 / DSM 8902 / Z-7692) TaxID=889378 RepID=H9ULQ4_SPIAZ|nr:HAD family hydrolase [Spirochaeta africana]AFG38447.1 putative phosphatase [Spirochaeta africana DSM 8902]